MAFIRNLTALFRSKSILVEIDPILLPQLNSLDKISVSRLITFNLYRLIYHIGTIQTRRFATSNRLKFFDKTDLIEKIYHDTNEVRIRINDIRQINGSETLTTVSEDFGVGISVVISESLFDIKRSSIQKIYGTSKRPDWKCQMNDNRILVVESKGSTSVQTSNSQVRNAIIQKNKHRGDIKIASLTVLNENSISEARYLDPPIESNNNSPEMENHILRAGHYASVFSFLGNSKLSRYYSQMRKRLEGLITPIEQDIKNRAFRNLRLNAPRIHFEDKEFVGFFYNVDEGMYMFVGVDSRLLSYEGFINFNDYESEVDQIVSENHFIIYRDGVILIEINNIDYFNNIPNRNKIRNYQDNITISDIDEMNEISFSKYFVYLLKKKGFSSIQEQSARNRLPVDLKASLNGIDYYFEFKLFRNERDSRLIFEQLQQYRRMLGGNRLVLITNRKINIERLQDLNIIIIDRMMLTQIIKQNDFLLQLIIPNINNG